MVIHPEFFDSIEAFINHCLSEWEAQNPEPQPDTPTQPEIIEAEVLKVSNGIIAIEYLHNGNIQLHLSNRASGGAAVNLQLDKLVDLVGLLDYYMGAMNNLQQWRDEYGNEYKIYCEELRNYREARKKVILGAKNDYLEAHQQNAKNSKIGANNG